MNRSASSPFDPRRRRLMLASAAALGLSPLGRLLAAAGAASTAPGRLIDGFGPLRPVADRSTGLPLLQLPEGFSYCSFGWAGEPMADGKPTPGRHDGMGIVRAVGDRLTLVRNHEITAPSGAFGSPNHQYDPVAGGGTVTLEFDTAAGQLVSTTPSLSGTLMNCAGGVTPWGSWLSCEEMVVAAGTSLGDGDARRVLAHDHGFVFEVPADGGSDARPLRAMGQFRHEAAAVHAASGDIYMTEDQSPAAGFYRFRPNRPGVLAEGGRLQMLRAPDRPDLRRGLAAGERMAVEWVDIAEPEAGIDENGAAIGVQRQGFAAGASAFTRLEGCIATADEVFFTATDGGDARCGQLFVYRPAEQTLQLLFESRSPEELDYPDNIVQSPRGGLLVCQDSARLERQRLYGLTAAGELFVFAEQSVVLDGERGHRGDFRRAEWAGACFSPDGRWLFANVYAPGFTVAITGPWRDGLI